MHGNYGVLVWPRGFDWMPLSSCWQVVLQTKEMITKHAEKIAKQADEHQQFLNKVSRRHLNLPPPGSLSTFMTRLLTRHPEPFLRFTSPAVHFSHLFGSRPVLSWCGPPGLVSPSFRTYYRVPYPTLPYQAVMARTNVWRVP